MFPEIKKENIEEYVFRHFGVRPKYIIPVIDSAFLSVSGSSYTIDVSSLNVFYFGHFRLTTLGPNATYECRNLKQFGVGSTLMVAASNLVFAGYLVDRTTNIDKSDVLNCFRYVVFDYFRFRCAVSGSGGCNFQFSGFKVAW